MPAWFTRTVRLVLLGVLALGLVVGGCAIYALAPRTQQVQGPERIVEQTKIVEKPVTQVVEKVVTATPVPTATPNVQATVVALVTQVASGKPATPAATTPIVISGSFPSTVAVSGTTTQTTTKVITAGVWTIQYITGTTTAMSGWTFKNPDPALWPVFPNVDNAGYPAANGVEYGMAESVFCQTGSCNIPVAAQHYRLITADYDIPNVDKCEAENGVGCALSMWNVGIVTSDLKGASVRQGFTVFGRYWNGDVLPHAVWALMSHSANNMLNLKSTLNPGSVNAGANCSVPGGCLGVRMTFVVMSGNEVLLKGVTTIKK